MKMYPLILSGFKDGTLYFSYGTVSPCIGLKTSLYDDSFIIVFPGSLTDIKAFSDACFLVLHITGQESICVNYKDQTYLSIGKGKDINSSDVLFEELHKFDDISFSDKSS